LNLFIFLPILLYLIPIAFIVWYLIYFLKLQKEKNNILKNISDKLENLKR